MSSLDIIHQRFVRTIEYFVWDYSSWKKPNGTERQAFRIYSISFNCKRVKRISIRLVNTMNNDRKWIFIFRFARKLSETYEFIITVCFLWGVLTISSTLLMVQSEIVKLYFLLNHSKWYECLSCESNNDFCVFISILVTKSRKPNGVYSTINIDLLVVLFNLHDLWLWRKSIQSFRWYCRCFMPTSMVWVAKWSTTNSTDYYDVGPTAGHYWRLWEYSTPERSVQKSETMNFLFYRSKSVLSG